MSLMLGLYYYTKATLFEVELICSLESYEPLIRESLMDLIFVRPPGHIALSIISTKRCVVNVDNAASLTVIIFGSMTHFPYIGLNIIIVMNFNYALPEL